MFTLRYRVGLSFLATLVAFSAAPLIRAQIGRISVEPDNYRVRVVNQLGEWARIGMIGYNRDANLRVELREGSSWTGNLYAGHRVVVAWDREQNLLFAAEVQIQGSGTLRLQRMMPMMADPDVARKGAAARRQSPLPTITIEP